MTKAKQASFTAVAVFAVGALGIALDAGSSGDNSALLDTKNVPPQQVYVQLTSAYPDLGNVLILAQLTSDQVAQKDAEGKGDFISLGKDQEILLRDDGLAPDELADDGLYTAIAFIDQAELLERSREDEGVLAKEGLKDLPVFSGRTILHYEKQQAFDYAAFSAGKRVPLEFPVVELEPEDSKAAPTQSEGAGLATSAAIAPPPPITRPNPTPSPGFTNLFQERVLVIRNPAVVQDPARTYDPCTNSGAPAGVWSFNHLMTQMANQQASGIDPALFVEGWLQTWTANQTINSFNVPSRNQMQQIINQWPRTNNGRLDLAQSPLRLLAIMPRVDLRRTTGGGGYSGGSSGNFIDAGELRFIFGFVLPPGWDATGFNGVISIDGGIGNASCRAIPFTVIFEYEVPACGCGDVKDWAADWVKLRHLDPFTQAYRKHLTSLTQKIVRANADPNKPNGSALRTLRTNEVALLAPWELREFQLTQARFSLINETTADDTPHDSFFNTQVLRNWLTNVIQPNLTAPLFENPVPPVRLFFSNVNFLGANPRVPHPPILPPTTAPFTFFWTTPNLANLSANSGMNSQNWARHRVSRATCSGCHRRETNTPFVHVDNANATFPVPPVPISGFLSGINNVADPAEAAGLPARHFDDLLRREIDIKQVAGAHCFGVHPINKHHVLESLETTGRLPADLFANLERVPVSQRPRMALQDLMANLPSEVH